MSWISGMCGEAYTALRLECSDPWGSETDPWCAVLHQEAEYGHNCVRYPGSQGCVVNHALP